ncbi:DUF2793 domain-containing protein [Erythrobacter sp. AP23]|uniref:DUF2793 domain-containing protein n=1 Tax=Erythrobacter sp. AP23 TaxID=499656 RepID=UPI0009F8A291|nr:DUF2793 domain-containing protein [Erythrobacter sp. AP23]
MTQPIDFETVSARHAFPLLVAGQAQKEFYVNESLARIDTLLHPVVEGDASAPPAAPSPGDCWIVASPASGAWEGREDFLASWDGTQWTLCQPCEGMHVFDRSNGKRRAYLSGWQQAVRPALPAGGSNVDVEARASIEAIIDILATLAIFPSN